MKNFSKRLSCFILGLTLVLGVGLTSSNNETIDAKATDTSTTIEEVYSMNENASVSNVYGYYVGTINGSSYIMDGELGMMLFKLSASSLWKVGETLLKITSSKLDIYYGVYELTNVKYETSDDVTKADAPITYQITGSEATTDSKLWNRLASVTGVPSDITTTYSAANTTFTIKVNEKDVTVHIKKNEFTNEVYTALKTAQDASTEITVVGITTVYKNAFQLGGMYVVEKDISYTAENFADELLTSTNEACVYSKDNGWVDVSSKLGGTWATLETNFKGKLSSSEQDKLIEATANDNGTNIEKAVNRYLHIVNRYHFANFMGRADVKASNNLFINNENSNVSITVIVLVSVISVSLIIGANLIIRKRKVN